MLIVGRILTDWRARNVLPPDPAKPITFRLVTDGDSESAPWPRVVSTVEMGESDVAACVPFKVTDELYTNEDDDAQVGLYVESIVDAHRGKAIFGDRCVIHRLTGGRVSYETDLGVAAKATISWEGIASWRPA